MKENKRTWQLNQILGNSSNKSKNEYITCLEFNKFGHYLAIGDSLGRLIILEKINSENNKKKTLEYGYLTEFQAYEENFDFKRNKDLSSKINFIKWLKNDGDNFFILTSNDNKIKLWKLKNEFEKNIIEREEKLDLKMKIPKTKIVDQNMKSYLKQEFFNPHRFYIKSLCLSNNKENFLSFDQFSIFLHSFEKPWKNYLIKNIFDQEIKKIFTSVKFHPEKDFLFYFSNSLGEINFCDMRINSNFKSQKKFFKKNSLNYYYFQDISEYISDIEFNYDNKFLISRSLHTINIWDLRNTKEVYESIEIFPDFFQNLGKIYETDEIIPDFKIKAHKKKNEIFTGFYNKTFFSYNFENGNSEKKLNFFDKEKKFINLGNEKEIENYYFDDFKYISLIAMNPEYNSLVFADKNELFFFKR